MQLPRRAARIAAHLIILLLAAPAVIGFKEESVKDWWKAIGVGTAAVILWFFIFLALTSSSLHVIH